MASYRAAAPMRKITSFEAMLIAGLATAAVGEEERTRKAMLAIGSEEFQESCAACHGADASGRGELADKLVKPPKTSPGSPNKTAGRSRFGECLTS